MKAVFLKCIKTADFFPLQNADDILVKGSKKVRGLLITSSPLPFCCLESAFPSFC